MSKYGPAWVWPAAGLADKSLPSQPKAGGREDQRVGTTVPPGCQGPGRVSECMARLPEGEAVATASGKGKIRRKQKLIKRASGTAQPGICPQKPEGSDVTLAPQSGRTRQGEWGGEQRAVTNPQTPRCSDHHRPGDTLPHLGS